MARLRRQLRDTAREKDQAIQRYTEAKTTLRAGRQATEDTGTVHAYVLRVEEEIAYWRDLYYGVVPPDQWARSFRRPS